MGTTATALRTQPGVVIRYVLAIEGYENLITDHATPSAVVTAWAGSGWTAAIPGLKVNGRFSQRIEPWQNEFEIPTIRVSVEPLAGDVFGRAVFKTKPSFVTRLNNTFAPDPDGSGTIEVKSTSGAAGSGDVYIGTQRHSYSSTGAGQFNVGAAGAGKHNPFSADGANILAGPATHAEGLNYDVAAPPLVTDAPPTWLGRKVALYVHRVVGGVLDLRTQALLEFAGRIRGIEDTSETGETVLELEDMRSCIRDTVLLRRQWTGYVRPGVRLLAGWRFRGGTRIKGSTSGVTYSDDLVVVPSGASGVYEMNEGLYEISELLAKFDTWLAADPSIDGDWSFSIKNLDEGPRLSISATFASGSDPRQIFFMSSAYPLWDFLGVDVAGLTGYRSPDTDWKYMIGESTEDEDEIATATGDRAPTATKFAHRTILPNRVTTVDIELESTEGTLFNQRAWLPRGLKDRTLDGDTWSAVKVGNVVYLARFASATRIDRLLKRAGPLRYVDDPYDPDEDGVEIGAEDPRLAVRQVLVLAGTFTDLFTQLLASIGGSAGVNHTDYDVLPWGAGIPWSLLGSAWLSSCRALEESLNSKSITTLITEPTRLEDLLIPELAMRFAWLVWKDEGYQLVTLPTPNALSADYVLDETNKADAVGSRSSGRSVAMVSQEFLRNVVNLKYARSADGKYRRTLEVVDSPSVSTYGARRATIEATNSFGDPASVGSSVEEMAAALVSRVLPVFAKPLRTLRRSIAPTLSAIAPGDTVVVSDNHARNPETGARGIAGRGAVVIGTSFDRGLHGGKWHGEVDLLLVDEDRHYPLAPVAEVDTSYSGTLDGRTFTNGYADTAAGGPALKLKANAYSRAADPDDVTHWAAGYKGRLVRLDGAISGDAWNVTVSSVDAADGYVVIGGDLSAPSFTAGAAEKYRLRFREYSACTDAQKLYAFQADDGDGLIENSAQPNTYGTPQWQEFAAPTLTAPPNLPILTEVAGDGEPFDASIFHDLALLNNNLANYRTAPNLPILNRSPVNTMSTDYVLAMVAPVFVGPPAAAGLVRKLYVAPLMRTLDVANTVWVRVTAGSTIPRILPGDAEVSFVGTTRSVEFSSSSTTLAEATEQALEPVVGEGTVTWLAVEYKATDGVNLSQLFGLSRCYLGPAEVP